MLQGKFMVNGLHVKKEVSTAIFVRKKKPKLIYQFMNMNIVAAFRGMRVSPAKHSSV